MRPGGEATSILVEPPTVVQPVAEAPLARLVVFDLDTEAEITGTATDGEHRIAISAPAARHHELPLVGLYPDATWAVALTATTTDGRRLALAPITFTTASLPETFPHVDLRGSVPAEMQPGFTLAPMTSPEHAAYLVVFDEEGRVAWYYDGAGTRFQEARIRPDGHILTLHSDEILELDWLGRIRSAILSDLAVHTEGLPTGLGNMDHEISVDAAGRYLTLTQVGTELDEFPLTYASSVVRGPARIAEDRIVAIDPATGTVEQTWSYLDIFDPGRLAFDSLNDAGPGFDWAHANAVTPVGDDHMLVSARNQDALAFVATDGTVEWILANHANWSPAFQPLLLEPVGEPFAWQYHQHAPKYDDGRILLFDNGNFRASPWTGEVSLSTTETWSRVVQYTVDAEAMTVRQDFEIRLDPDVFSSAMGDADWLPNGHVLATFAYIFAEDHLQPVELGRGAPSFRIVELDPSTGAEVWDLDVWAEAGSAAPNWQTFRAERFPAFDLSGLGP